MTPKEKAYELILKVEKQLIGNQVYRGTTKKLALIAVDEVIEALHEHHWQNRIIIDYWEEVKNKINNL